MPVHKGKDTDGEFYQWGSHGKKYHFEDGNVNSENEAHRKATKQGQAAHAAGYTGESMLPDDLEDD